MANQEQVLAVIEGVRGVTMGNMDTLTDVKLNGGKNNPMLGRVQKLTTGIQVMICRSDANGSNAYENKVNRHLAAEGKVCDFKSAGLPSWAEMVSFPVFKHIEKGTHYLQAIYLNAGTGTTYLLDGKPINKADIIGLPEKKDEGHQGGVDNKVYVRTPKLENIVEIRMMGEVID